MGGKNLIDANGATPPFNVISVSLRGIAEACHSVHHELVADSDAIRRLHVNQYSVVILINEMIIGDRSRDAFDTAPAVFVVSGG